MLVSSVCRIDNRHAAVSLLPARHVSTLIMMIVLINASLPPSLSPSDRQVVMGNHRDAWVFGAVDPNSGTAGLMEIARVAGLLRKNSEWQGEAE